MIEFTAYGKPETQGSMIPIRSRNTGRLFAKPDNPKTYSWRSEVAWAASRARITPFERGVPLVLSARFYFPRPESVKRKHPTAKPDLGKLVRAIEDALSKGLAYHDDAQIVEYGAIGKSYGTPARVEIRITALE